MDRRLLAQLPNHERRRILALDGSDHEELARRRLAGEPLQYLEGTADFVDITVTVDERVLIPRPETEGLFQLAVGEATQPDVIVDLGTGSGVLAIALRRRFPGAEVHAVDVSAPALDLARHNAAELGATIDFHLGDLLAALPSRLAGGVDLIVSNPPYVSEAEWDELPIDVRHEPRQALVSGPRGTEVLERIAVESAGWLSPGGVVAAEIGETQAEAAAAIFTRIGPPRLERDLAGRWRYVIARKAP